MGEFLIPILPKRIVSFDGLQATGQSQYLPLVDRVNVLQWREITLHVNVHSVSNPGNGNVIYIYAARQSWTPEDPGVIFVDHFGLDEWITIDNTTVSPAFLRQVIPTGGSSSNPVGDMIRIVAEGVRSNPGSINATISAALSVKDV